MVIIIRNLILSTERICIGNYTGECEHQQCTYTFLDNECGCEDYDKFKLHDNGKNCSGNSAEDSVLVLLELLLLQMLMNV